jgi:hypothetical protein
VSSTSRSTIVEGASGGAPPVPVGRGLPPCLPLPLGLSLGEPVGLSKVPVGLSKVPVGRSKVPVGLSKVPVNDPVRRSWTRVPL